MSQPIPSVDVAEAERLLREDEPPAVLIDVRETNEFVEVRVPGSVLVPMSEFLARIGELPADRRLLVFCRTGNRSAAVTNFLLQNGQAKAVNVAGGIVAWERAGLPIRRGPLEPGEGAPGG